MLGWRWVSESGPAGAADLSGEYPNQGEAESWLGESYLELLESGIRAVSLYQGDRLVYGPMSLEAEGT